MADSVGEQPLRGESPAAIMSVSPQAYDDFAKQLRESCLTRQTPCGKKKIVFFFTFQVKLFWNPRLAKMELLINTLSVITAVVAIIVAVVGSENVSDSIVVTNSIIGGVALLAGNILLHFWYGFLRYPSLARSFLRHYRAGDDPQENKSLDADFERYRDRFSFLYHGDSIRRSQWPAMMVTLPFTFAIHFVSGLFTICAFVIESIPCGDDDEPDLIKMAAYSGLMGVLAGSLFFPLLFTFGPFPAKICASLGLLVSEELYSSLLFRKDFMSFIKSLFVGALFDILDGDLTFDGLGPGKDTEVSAIVGLSQAIRGADAEIKEHETDQNESDSRTLLGPSHIDSSSPEPDYERHGCSRERSVEDITHSEAAIQVQAYSEPSKKNRKSRAKEKHPDTQKGFMSVIKAFFDNCDRALFKSDRQSEGPSIGKREVVLEDPSHGKSEHVEQLPTRYVADLEECIVGVENERSQPIEFLDADIKLNYLNEPDSTAQEDPSVNSPQRPSERNARNPYAPVHGFTRPRPDVVDERPHEMSERAQHAAESKQPDTQDDFVHTDFVEDFYFGGSSQGEIEEIDIDSSSDSSRWSV